MGSAIFFIAFAFAFGDSWEEDLDPLERGVEPVLYWTPLVCEMALKCASVYIYGK